MADEKQEVPQVNELQQDAKPQEQQQQQDTVPQYQPQEQQQDAAPQQQKRGAENPAKIGYCIFNSVEQLVHYFKNLLVQSPKNLDMNEYEHMALLGLLKQHPEWDKKAGAGIKSFQVREIDVPDGKARAYVAMRKDGSMEDFSYIKCASQLYPGEVGAGNQHKKPRTEGGEHGGGRGSRRGGGGGRQSGKGRSGGGGRHSRGGRHSGGHGSGGRGRR